MNNQQFSIYLNTLRQKGNLAYEYNPLHNYQTDKDLYLIDGKFIVPSDQAVNTKNGELLTKGRDKSNNSIWLDKRGNRITEGVKTPSGTPWAKAGSIIDLDTEQLNFDLNHPVDIEVQPSYDGSVNLILNDNKNIPRLINSRFSVREKDTYEIVDRIGENDTNVYNSNSFDKDTSLYFQYEYNPIISFTGFVKGVLPVGQYCFYFTYCDSDGNESDIIAETGLIPAFIGDNSDPYSMEGGIKNQLSDKGIKLELTNLDKSYNYLKVYYVRYFADYNQNRVYECKKIYQKFPVNSSDIFIQITGNEEAEDIDANILNLSKFNPKNVLTQAQCKNILFFGNVVKNIDNYKELSDLALRIIPSLNVVRSFDILGSDYISSLEKSAYYNVSNIYNKTGYFNQEYYRFGVVFIYQNGTLSNVYNTLGGVLDENNSLKLSGEIYSKTSNQLYLKRNYIKVDDKGWIKGDSSYTFKGKYLNSKGVCRFNYGREYDDQTIFSVKFTVPEEVSKTLREELGIRGLFFVRQKCTPNIIAQCYLLRMDEVLEAPVLEAKAKEGNKEYFTECFVNQNNKELTHDFESRLYKYNQLQNSVCYAGICPDFLLNQPYYNQIFNGGKFKLQKISSNSDLVRSDRFFNESKETKYFHNQAFTKATINTVTEEVPTVAIENKVFRLEMGQTEEVYKFKYAEENKGEYNAGDDNSINEVNSATNIVRGKYSPYLAIYSNGGFLETGCLYNILQENSLSEDQEYLNRMNSSEPFYAISNRYNIASKEEQFACWRGDCYINQFTYRLNRNFNDPSLPNNDKIIDYETWDNYDVNDSTKWKKISRSDLNAIQMGSWITIRVRSAMNYALRSVDHSYVSEEALMGSPRSFYPKSQLLQRGENKMPDSYLYNDAYRASLGFKCYYTLQDINYIKNSFSNRIQYSAISIQDSFKNNYRDSYSTYFRDYSQEYGSIQKLVGFEGYLLVVFEHAIGVAVVNERVLAGSGDGEPVFINTKNVLPEELTIITDTYGSQWPDSVVKSEAGYVYGVDTIAKKIWRVKGQQLEILSDFKVNKFLIDNITLGERELYPIIGLKNVKTHYNNNKKDIMFTFYDDIYKDEEKVWNLCYNELLGEFITFYSWVPSFSENIDTKFFSFNRDTSKYLSLLAKCNYSIPENTGVLVDNPVVKNINVFEQGNGLPKLYYSTINRSQVIPYTVMNEDGTTSQKSISKDGSNKNGRYLLPNVKFRIEKDHWGNYNLFKTLEVGSDTYLAAKNPNNLYNLYKAFENQKVIILYITPYLENQEDIISNTTISTNFSTESIAITLDTIVQNPMLTTDEKIRAGLTTDFYLHGQAGIFNVAESLYPTHWYGEYHPFEFEFIVNDKIAQQKMFTNLVLISNKAEPESFHFEVEGDNYEFSSDKRAMYFRQEATKNLYQNLGSDIIYDRKYIDVAAGGLTFEQAYRSSSDQYTDQYGKMDKVYPVYEGGLVRQVKSSIFPLYYEKIDTYNQIYHNYEEMRGNHFDFQNLSGSEIKWNRDLNQFDVVTHIKNNPIDIYGTLRGNSRYKDGRWEIQIPSIVFMQKNENEWVNPYEKLQEEGPLKDSVMEIPPIVINSQYIPNDLKDLNVSLEKLPNIYQGSYLTKSIQTGGWTQRKETRIRDKWVKIRVRYSGKNLAIIHSLATLYNISYS